MAEKIDYQNNEVIYILKSLDLTYLNNNNNVQNFGFEFSFIHIKLNEEKNKLLLTGIDDFIITNNLKSTIGKFMLNIGIRKF